MKTQIKLSMNELITKIQKVKNQGGLDLSIEEDLSVAIMNLLSLEEHLFFTGAKTKKNEYFDLLSEVRNIRKPLFGELINIHEGETWCVAKHLLATTMRLVEVGTKLQAEGRKDKAQEKFAYAYKIYSIFWGIRLKLLSLEDFKRVAKGDALERAKSKKFWSLQDISDRLVDCCDE